MTGGYGQMSGVGSMHQFPGMPVPSMTSSNMAAMSQRQFPDYGLVSANHGWNKTKISLMGIYLFKLFYYYYHYFKYL